MAEINWTEDQLAAIETTDKGVVVSAAAGSGKTAVLIERTIRLLADREKNISADSLLAVTFTVDATAQMKEKLSSALDEKLAQEQESENKKWLQKQKDKLSLAKINTINAFCLELVKNNIHEFELQYGIKILDENDAAVIVKNAVLGALDALADSAPQELDFLVDAVSDNNESQIEQLVTQLYYFLRSLPFPDSWTQDRLDEFTDEEKISDYVSVAAYDYIDLAQKALKLNEEAKALNYRIIEKYGVGKDQAAVLNGDEEIIKGLIKAVENGSWEDIWSYTVKFPWQVLRIPKKELTSEQLGAVTAAYEQIKKIREKYKALLDKSVKKSVEATGSHIREDLKTAKRAFSILCGLCKTTEQLAWAEKCSKNSLEFSDVERMALDLLVKSEGGKAVRTPLAEEIAASGEYKVILIDEFQDVNNLQELIFKALSDTDDLSIMGKNVFVVGDVKQSIYRFRQSNPQLFIDAKKNAADDKNKERARLVELKSNYRSRKNIIDFVNFVFENIMSEEVGELVYSGGEKLEPGAKYIGDDYDTEVMLITPDEAADAADDGEDEEENLGAEYSRENLVVAKRIRKMIDEKALVFDSKKGVQRPCMPSDFCVISRSKAATLKIGAALETVGLKAFTEEDSGYLRSREIAVMMNLLRVIDNPMQDIPMVSVMMSPLLSFTADETAQLRRLCYSEKGYTKHLYQIINAAAKDKQELHQKEAERIALDDKLLEEKCRYAAELITRLRFYASGMPLSRLIRRIYDETGFLVVASAYENSRQKRANLRMLLEYAALYENGGEGGVAGFIRYLESVEGSGKDFKQAVTVTEDKSSVIVKTIHKSKGLEYPFVFLCGISNQFKMTDIERTMMLDEYSGVGFNIYDHRKLTKTETISHKALKVIGRNKLLSEEIRLLYVAMTRAKEKLFIPVVMKRSVKAQFDTKQTVQNLAAEIAQSGGVNPRMIRSGESYLNWLMAVLLCYPKNEKLLEAMEVSVELPQLKTDAEITFSIVDDESGSALSQADFYNAKADEKRAAELVRRYAYCDKMQADAVPSKLTVTEIVREEKEREYGEKNPEFYPKLPQLSDELGKLSSAQKGTYTHLFMELADYESAATDAEAELKRLADEGYFSQKEAEGVYIGAVKKFFGGDFYKRMRKSDEIMREKQFLVSFSDLSLDEKYKKYVDGGSMLQGIADCIFKEDDGYVLVDYKTDNFSDVSQLYEYKTQLELYKAALDELLDLPVKACYIYSFKLNRGAEIELK